MNSNLNCKINLIQIYVFGILLLPYDAVHYLMPTSYAPISLYMFLIYILLYWGTSQWKIKLDKPSIMLIIFSVYTIINSILNSIKYVPGYSYFREYLLTLLCGLIVFFASNFAFKEIAQKYSYKKYIDLIMTLLGKAYVFPLIIGVIESLSMYGFLPIALKNTINMIFGGWQTGRICITTFEASWASVHMLIAFVVYLFLYTKYKSKKYLTFMLLSGILFVLTFSMQGVMILLVALLCFLFVRQITSKSLVHSLILILKIFLAICIIVFLFYNILKLIPNTYFASRILNFTSISNMILTDGSSFVRIGYILIHFLIFRDHFIFGIGSGSFVYVFADYVKEYYPKALGLTEVYTHVVNHNCNTVISIYASVFSETGVIGLILFATFILPILVKVKNIERKDSIFLLLVLILVVSPIQFGSWAYVPFWMGLAIINNLPKQNLVRELEI